MGQEGMAHGAHGAWRTGGGGGARDTGQMGWGQQCCATGGAAGALQSGTPIHSQGGGVLRPEEQLALGCAFCLFVKVRAVGVQPPGADGRAELLLPAQLPQSPGLHRI